MPIITLKYFTFKYFHKDHTVGQRNYFTTSVTVLYELPLVAVLSITGRNIFNAWNKYM